MACDPGANAFIEKYFADCVYNLRDYIGFCLGITAILFWLVAQVPQYVRNYKTKSADALSPWFLASWLLGDTTNLLGCLLQGQQLPTTTYTAMYFVMADVFMMMQYIYYGALSRRREKLLQLQARRRHHHRRHQHHSSSRSHTPSGSQQRHAAGGSSSSPSRRQPQQDEQRQQQQQQGQRHVTYSIDRDMEYGIGGSSKQQHLQQQDQQPADQQQQEPRVSQIYKNYCRQSSEGLALAMFMMAVCANLCTGTGIIMRTFTVRELMEQLPWIIGTLGTISLDMVILWQSLSISALVSSRLSYYAVCGL
ncbi:hypothetical protein OEZ86_002717 [Tetradesmus obliquus]|nr:hypothetical protein OEZ86_002717 [Tetradesmus obliquus]